MYDVTTQTITTERLRLRKFELSDAERVQELCNNYNIYKSTINLPYPYHLENAINWINTHKENFDNDRLYEFAISDKNSGTLYGAIGLSNNKNHKNGEVAYFIGEEFWGRGYGTEALTAIINFAFDYKNYHRIYARFFESNPASGRMMQKAKMAYEGKQIDHIFKENRYETLLLYGIIKNDNITCKNISDML